MKTELKMIYLLALIDGLTLQEIAGIDGWQPVIYTMIIKRAAVLCGRLNEITYDLIKATQNLAKKHNIIEPKKKKKTKVRGKKNGRKKNNTLY